jgi:hypothetical protein
VTSCATCGHQLGVGRFCTNCGAPVDASVSDGPSGSDLVAPVAAAPGAGDWRTDTAERRLTAAPADPRTPPAAVAPPPPPRYPLYADEVDSYPPVGPLTATGAGPGGDETQVEAPGEAGWSDSSAAGRPPDLDHDYDYDYDYDYDERRRSPVLWILAAALVLVLVAAGWWLFVRDDGSAPATDGGGSGGDGRSTHGTQTTAKDGTEVAGRASVRATKTAPPNEDVNGDQVSYDASNMLDGVPTTAWRAPGDGTGLKLSFTLREPTELHQVGLINGYAKTSTDGKGRSFDWYLGNRRIQEVLWTFDDGSTVRQRLEDARALQMIDVGDVVTRRVTLKLVTVSAPGTGTASRDFTAISEVSLVGDRPSS